MALMRGLPVRPFLLLATVLLALSWSAAGLAQKLVDPNKVAPEFRAAAEKRRAEQIKLSECSKKADQAKVLPRDRTVFVSGCLEQ
jgi:flagellar biosynthesis component FlhA